MREERSRSRETRIKKHLWDVPINAMYGSDLDFCWQSKYKTYELLEEFEYWWFDCIWLLKHVLIMKSGSFQITMLGFKNVCLLNYLRSIHVMPLDWLLNVLVEGAGWWRINEASLQNWCLYGNSFICSNYNFCFFDSIMTFHRRKLATDGSCKGRNTSQWLVVTDGHLIVRADYESTEWQKPTSRVIRLRPFSRRASTQQSSLRTSLCYLRV